MELDDWILVENVYQVSIIYITYLHHHLCLDLHEYLLDNSAIVVRDGSCLRHLDGLSTLPCYDEDIACLEHDEGGTDRIFARWYDPEVLTLSSLDPLAHTAYDRKRVLCICIIISQYYYIREDIDHTSHLGAFCLISISCSTEYGDDPLSSLDLLQRLEYALERGFCMCIVDIYLGSAHVRHFFQTSWHTVESCDHLLDHRDIDLL